MRLRVSIYINDLILKFFLLFILLLLIIFVHDLINQHFGLLLLFALVIFGHLDAFFDNVELLLWVLPILLILQPLMVFIDSGEPVAEDEFYSVVQSARLVILTFSDRGVVPGFL